MKVVDGRGRALGFGGQVMKNVAGYDVSRLFSGSLGILGLIAEASLKVLPEPPAETTLRLEMSEARAIEALNRWAGQPIPVSASAWHDGALLVRLSGSEPALQAASQKIGGEPLEGAIGFWLSVREQTHAHFSGTAPLWRLALPSATQPLGLPGTLLIEWGGALRWLRSSMEAAAVRAAAAGAGGHATLFRGTAGGASAFAPLGPVQLRLHRELKAAFDPIGIFNPGRLYPEL